ncbi:MAG: hypothetical protein JNM18_05585 [Planctomycetaceae bacterium]|nr:hypothetical protein [Planctomycetaceae bacterium]
MTAPTLGEVRLRWLLMVLAGLDLLALVAVVVPRETLAQVHAALGLGEFATGPVTIYLARTISLLYAFQGATFWHLASDVRKYQPLIALWGRLTLVGAAIFLAVDVAAGLPWWWAIGETICVVGIGGSLLWGVSGLETTANSAPSRRTREVSIDDPAEVGS